jgi:hypothetical protein
VYLTSPYQDALLPGGLAILRRLFKLGLITDQLQYARILSLEYTLQHFGGRVRIEF